MLKKNKLAKALRCNKNFKYIFNNMDACELWNDDFFTKHAIEERIGISKYNKSVDVLPNEVTITLKGIDSYISPIREYRDKLVFNWLVFVINIEGIEAMEVNVRKNSVSVKTNYKIPKSVIRVINEWSKEQLILAKSRKDNNHTQQINQNQEIINNVGERLKSVKIQVQDR